MHIPQKSVSLSLEQQAMLRQYRRMWLTEIDLEEAKGAIEEIFKRDLRRSSHHPPTPLLQSLTTALIVSYARPFVLSRGDPHFADRTVPGSLLKVLTPIEQKFHEHLISIRNREVAHSDADVTQVSLELLDGGHGSISIVTRKPLNRHQLRLLLRMISKLLDELERRFELLRDQLPLNVSL